MKKDEADHVVDIFTDENAWSATVLVGLLKGAGIAVVFMLITTLLFKGLWLWIGIGAVLLIVLPVFNVMRLIKARDEFLEVDNMLGGLPDELKKNVLKSIVKDSLKAGINSNDSKKLSEKTVVELIGKLKADNVLSSDLKITPDSIKETYDVIKLLRNHADDRICHYDCECIEDDGDYAGLVQEHFAITQGELTVKDIRSTYDYENKSCEINFKYKDKEVAWELRQDSDWVSQEFFKLIGDFALTNTESEFLMFPAEDQCAEIIFIPKKSATFLKKNNILFSLL